ncbi:hypothetical protein ABIB81_009085 [Bradyrhizobium sp. I1.7.5]
MKQWFEAKLDHLAEKSDTAKALRYALRHWDGLTLYLDDGRIEMDTNAVERAMRPIKLNAKNSLFAGCDEGAENWAVLASLIETALCRARHSAVWTKPLRGRTLGKSGRSSDEGMRLKQL